MRFFRAFFVLAIIAIAALPTKAVAQSSNLNTLNRQISQLRQEGRYAEAVELAQRYVALARTRRGDNHPDFAMALGWLASLYEILGRNEEAEPLLKQALAIRERAYGTSSAIVSETLNNLANVYENLGRYSEAEPLYKRCLTIAERVVGPNHKDFATILNNLGHLYTQQDRYDEAEPLYLRALEIRLKVLGTNDRITAQSVNNLGYLYMHQGRKADAQQLLEQALAMRERILRPDHPDIAEALTNLASLYRDLGRLKDAEPLFKRSLAIHEKALGADHPNTALALNNLATIYSEQGRIADAEQLYGRTLTILRDKLGPDHPRVAATLGNLGLIHFERKDWRASLAIFRQSADVIIRRTRREQLSVGRDLTSGGESDAEREGANFAALIKSAFRLATAEPSQHLRLARETFADVQWVLGSQAASSLDQMAARHVKDDSALAALVRERQELVNEWHGLDKQLMQLAAQSGEQRNPQVQRAQRMRLAAIDGRMADVDRSLSKDFPEYAALASPEPLSAVDTQGLLGPNEALVVMLDTAEVSPKVEETFIWVVTKTELRWIRSDLGTDDLIDDVAALRCGLDATLWEDATNWLDTTEELAREKKEQVARRERCETLLKAKPTTELAGIVPIKVLPFDAGRAHKIYKSFFGQIEDVIRDKHLLIVPSGALTSFPFSALVTVAPKTAIPAKLADYRGVTWLSGRQATTVLPSVVSLKALRAHVKKSRAIQPFIGIGNPLLLGRTGNDRSAWQRQSCGGASSPSDQVAARGLRGSIPKFFKGDLADVSVVRAQLPLPETADELCAVARSIGANEGTVYLGERATERTVKSLSAEGALAGARIVHFATHGLLAGETRTIAASRAEPALILTPPNRASEEDDGLLTASEIAQLKLDAEWVVLSACNTAGAATDKPGAQALSGLARAFFFAGARALLVSHWAVDSDATVRLITNAFSELKAAPQIGRGEALRRSMQALIASGGRYAHPANWAPFVVVGEGAR